MYPLSNSPAMPVPAGTEATLVKNLRCLKANLANLKSLPTPLAGPIPRPLGEPEWGNCLPSIVSYLLTANGIPNHL